MGGDEPGVLRFPEDELHTWEVLLFWLVKSVLPGKVRYVAKQPEITLLVECWIMGDLYCCPQFQDAIMLELLDLTYEMAWTLDEVTVAFKNTMPETPLRRLAAEEALYAMQLGGIFEMTDLELLDDVVGLLSSMLKAGEKSAESVSKHGGKFGQTGERFQGDLWKEYMVGSGPADHWVFERYRVPAYEK